VFGRDFYAGSPAVTENSFGQGKAVYVATDPAESFLEELARHYSAQAQILPTVRAPSGVEVVIRENEQGRFLFLLNHGVKSARVSLGRESGVDLLSGKRARGTASIPARGVMILRSASRPG
jgi:beta-galactosidase